MSKTPIRFWGTGADNASDARDNLWLEAKTKDINTQTWTTYTLVLTDQSKIVEMNNASANILTIPANADVAFPVWTTLEITQYGAWITTATWDTGVTVNGTSAGSLATTTQYQSIYLYKRATNEWIAWLKPIEIGWGGGWGFNLKYPHDITSGFEAINEEISTSITYTVPTGKVLYIQHTSTGNTSGALVEIWWLRYSRPIYSTWWDNYLSNANVSIIEAWEDIDCSVNDGMVHWFLCDENADIEPIYFNSSYTVPASKILVVTEINNSWVNTSTIDGTASFYWLLWNTSADISMNVIHQSILLWAGKIIVPWANASFFWYLIPDDFDI